MQDYDTPKGKQLTLADRSHIEPWLKEGHSNREIARRLTKAPQSINKGSQTGISGAAGAYRKYEPVNQALGMISKDYPIHSITADNKIEFSRLSDVFAHYAHPYWSWERKINENHNRLIRRCLP